MKGSRAEFIVGLFALLVFAVLAFMTFKVGEISLKKKAGYSLYAYFRDTGGLDEKTSVKIAGVAAGTIEKIDLVNGRARLTIRMDPKVKLYSDASAAIKSTGLLGDKYLDIRIGSKEPVLGDGNTIRHVREVMDVDDLVRNVSEVSNNLNDLVKSLNQPDVTQSVRQTMMNLRDITAELKDVISRNDLKFQSVLDRIDSLVASMDAIMKENREPLARTLSNFEDFSGSLKARGPEIIERLDAASEDLRTLLRDNRQDIQSIVKKTNETMDSVNRITKKVESGEGTVGKLFADDRLYNSLTEAASGVSNTVGMVNRLRTYFTFQADYLTDLSDTKGKFYLTLAPRPDKYYIFGVTADPIGSVKATETVDGTVIKKDVEKEIEFTAQFAKRFRDTALRIGMTENTFGLGADQFLLDDKMKLSLDAWDFGKNEFSAKSPHVRLGVDFFVFKHLFLTGGMDNLFNEETRSPFVGGGLRFEDEDFKYLFGAVPKVPGQ